MWDVGYAWKPKCAQGFLNSDIDPVMNLQTSTVRARHYTGNTDAFLMKLPVSASCTKVVDDCS